MSNQPFGEITPARLAADADATARAYHGLSLRYAADGDVFSAVHASWAADVHVVQSVLWQHVLGADPQAEDSYAVAVQVIGEALAAYTDTSALASVEDAADQVRAARAGLAAAFEQPLLAEVTARFAPLDHLDGLPVPGQDAADRVAEEVLRGQFPDVLAQQQRFAAVDGIAVARGLARAGLEDDAFTQAWLADWSALAAYLLDAAILGGDQWLVTVQMRWALVCAEVARIPALPAGVPQALGVVRTRMAAALGPIEGARLLERFTPLV